MPLRAMSGQDERNGVTDQAQQAPMAGKQAPAMRGIGSPASRHLPPLVVTLFMVAMVVPVWMQVGPLLLMPHRIILLLLFMPLVVQLVIGRVGRIGIYDVLMVLSAAWAVLAIHLNEKASIEAIGIYVLESLGAYLLGRVAIRSRDDFMAFVRIFFWALIILVPFAVVEAVTHRAVMLEMIPQSVQVVYTEHRWGLRRAQTVFGHPILFGVFSGIGFGLFWYVIRTRVMQVGGATLAAAGTFFSLSTGALISITMQIIFIVWERLTRQFKRRWTVFAILFAIFYITIDLLSNRTPFHVLITYATFNTGSAYNRILIWRFGMENVWANPWFGLGENVFSWERPSWMNSSADNFWLLMTMKFGIPSFLAMATALFIIIRRVSLAPLKDPLAQACRAGYLTTVGGLIIAGGTVHFWHGVMAFVMFIFGSGVWLIQAGRDDAATPDVSESDGPPPDDILPEDSGMIYTRQPVRHTRPKASAATSKTARAARSKVRE